MSDKESRLTKVLGSELAEAVLGKTQSKADALKAMGIESKDIDTSAEATEATSSEVNTEETVEVEADVEVTIEAESTEVVEEEDSEEVVEEEVTSEPVSALVDAITDDVVKSVTENLHIEDLNALLTAVLQGQMDLKARMDTLEVADEVKINEGIAKEMGTPVWKGYKASGDDSNLIDDALEDGTKRPKGPTIPEKPGNTALSSLKPFIEGAGLGILDGGNQ